MLIGQALTTVALLSTETVWSKWLLLYCALNVLRGAEDMKSFKSVQCNITQLDYYAHKTQDYL